MSAPSGQSRRTSLRFEDESLAQVPVRIGEIRVARGSSLLFTIGLGSCVAVALYDPGVRVGGLAHAMLPRPEGSRRGAPRGRFATTAVEDLLEMMQQNGASLRRISVRLAGGASMFRDVLESDGLRLGRRNVEAARASLEAAGLAVAGEDTLGTWGRSVFLRTTDGLLLVSSVNHDDIIL